MQGARRSLARSAAAWPAVALLATGAAGAGQTTPPTPERVEAGARLERKLARIVDNAATAADEPRLTLLLEAEINAYLEIQGVAQLPTGLTEPSVDIGENGLVAATAVIDLNRIREERARSWLDPLQYLTGRLPVSARGRVEARDGLARLEIESVAIGGVPVPLTVLQELVQFYTRTASHPDGTRLDEPIPLPYRITELRLSPGRAVVVQ